MTTDPFLAAAWAVGALSLWEASHGRPSAWWAVGGALAVGLLAKHTMLAFVPGMLGYLAGRAGRRWRGASLALGLGLLGLVPPLLWNIQHDWATLRHLADLSSPTRAAGRPALATAAEFVASQAGILGVTLFAAALAALGREGGAALQGDDRGRFAAWLSLPILLGFLALSLRTRVNPNWAFPGYLVAFAALGARAAARRAGRSPWRRRARLVVLLGPPALLTAVGLAGLPGPVAAVLPPRLDPANRLIGWRELGAGVARVADGLRPPDGRLFLAGSRYQVVAELAFYVPGHPIVYCPSTDRGPTQYDYWPGPDPLVGWDALYVNAGDGPIDPGVAGRFAAVEALPPLVVRRHGRPIRTHAVFHLRGFRGS